MRVTLDATLAPSEDPDKVLNAMRMIIGEDALLAYQNRRMTRLISEDINSLNMLRNQLRDRHIRAAARKLLLRELKGNSTSLFLNKQAATAGVVALCSSPDQSPLGPIYVTIDSRQVVAVIDWLTAYESG